MTTSTARGRRPRLAVTHGYRSVSFMQLASSARSVCDLIWVVDGRSPEVAGAGRLLRRLGTVVDVGGMAPDQAAATVAAAEPDGIATFRDDDILLAAQIAEQLGLSYPDPAVALGLVDKLVQRQTLRDAGVAVPSFWPVPALADTKALAALSATVEFPAVIKPRRASGSWHTFLVADRAELVALLDDLEQSGDDPGEPRLLEGYIEGRPEGSPGGLADYLSVESVCQGGSIDHIAVTGRLPTAPPFRETGFVLPALLHASELGPVLDLASSAVRALGVGVGCVHTEIKLTPAGPRVIEVNGRPGGGIPDLLGLTCGVDFLATAMQVALGVEQRFDGLLPAHRVAYRFLYQPPIWARRVVCVEGLDRVGTLPGVHSVVMRRSVGDAIDTRQGSRSNIFAVVGSTADHAGVHKALRCIEETVQVTYSGSSETLAVQSRPHVRAPRTTEVA